MWNTPNFHHSHISTTEGELVNKQKRKRDWKKIFKGLTEFKEGGPNPHEKINRCLTDIKRCLTHIFKIYQILTNISQILKMSFIKYWLHQLNIGLYWLYRFTQISTLVIFNRCLANTNRYILETNIIYKIG